MGHCVYYEMESYGTQYLMACTDYPAKVHGTLLLAQTVLGTTWVLRIRNTPLNKKKYLLTKWKIGFILFTTHFYLLRNFLPECFLCKLEIYKRYVSRTLEGENFFWKINFINNMKIKIIEYLDILKVNFRMASLPT